MRKTAPDPTLVILRLGLGSWSHFASCPKSIPEREGLNAAHAFSFISFSVLRVSRFYTRVQSTSRLLLSDDLFCPASLLSLSNTCNRPLLRSNVLVEGCVYCLAWLPTGLCWSAKYWQRKIMNVPVCFSFFYWSRTFIFTYPNKMKNVGGNDNSMQGRLPIKNYRITIAYNPIY